LKNLHEHKSRGQILRGHSLVAAVLTEGVSERAKPSTLKKLSRMERTLIDSALERFGAAGTFASNATSPQIYKALRLAIDSGELSRLGEKAAKNLTARIHERVLIARMKGNLTEEVDDLCESSLGWKNIKKLYSKGMAKFIEATRLTGKVTADRFAMPSPSNSTNTEWAIVVPGDASRSGSRALKELVRRTLRNKKDWGRINIDGSNASPDGKYTEIYFQEDF